jgi:hypothetical protein
VGRRPLGGDYRWVSGSPWLDRAPRRFRAGIVSACV